MTTNEAAAWGPLKGQDYFTANTALGYSHITNSVWCSLVACTYRQATFFQHPLFCVLCGYHNKSWLSLPTSLTHSSLQCYNTACRSCVLIIYKSHSSPISKMLLKFYKTRNFIIKTPHSSLSWARLMHSMPFSNWFVSPPNFCIHFFPIWATWPAHHQISVYYIIIL